MQQVCYDSSNICVKGRHGASHNVPRKLPTLVCLSLSPFFFCWCRSSSSHESMTAVGLPCPKYRLRLVITVASKANPKWISFWIPSEFSSIAWPLVEHPTANNECHDILQRGFGVPQCHFVGSMCLGYVGQHLMWSR